MLGDQQRYVFAMDTEDGPLARRCEDETGFQVLEVWGLERAQREAMLLTATTGRDVWLQKVTSVGQYQAVCRLQEAA